MKIISIFVSMLLISISGYAQLSLSSSKSSYIGNYGVSCNGANDGNIKVFVGSGGVPPFTFSWSNGAFSEDLAHLQPGAYFVQVTDRNQCLVVDSVFLTTEDSLEFPSQITFYCKNVGMIKAMTIHYMNIPPDTEITCLLNKYFINR